MLVIVEIENSAGARYCELIKYLNENNLNFVKG